MLSFNKLVNSILFCAVQGVYVTPKGGAKVSPKGLGEADAADLLKLEGAQEYKAREIAITRSQQLNGDDRQQWLDGMESAFIKAGKSKAYARNNKGNFKAIMEAFSLTVHMPEYKDGKEVKLESGAIKTIEVKGEEVLPKTKTFADMVNRARDIRKAAQTAVGTTDGRGKSTGSVRKLSDAKFDAISKEINARATPGQVMGLIDLLCGVLLSRYPYCKEQVAKIRGIGGEIGDAIRAKHDEEVAKIKQLSEVLPVAGTAASEGKTDAPSPATVTDVSPQNQEQQQAA